MTMPGKAMLSTSYLGPVQYYSKFLLHREIVVEQCENYQKQSYRNRCCIYGANGSQCLVIPVSKGIDRKTPIREVTIDYSKPWQKIHWKSIESAYRLSPCFEFFEDELSGFYAKESHTKFLFDWNNRLTEVMLDLLKISANLTFTSVYEKTPADGADYRELIHPKKRLSRPDPHYNSIPYQQVFDSKYGFIPNLSIIDLLFNEGNHARDVLEEGIIR
jgi:WbqC-like protein family